MKATKKLRMGYNLSMNNSNVRWKKDTIYFQSKPAEKTTTKILFLGDICPNGRIPHEITTASPREIFGGIYDAAKTCDVSIFNLECPLTHNEKSVEKCGPSLKGDPRFASKLKLARKNLACIANNHIGDYGIRGLEETIFFLKQNSIEAIGAGVGKAKCADTVIEQNGKRLFVINTADGEFSSQRWQEWGACSHESLRFLGTNNVFSSSDFRILVLHDGRENYMYPPPYLWRLANQAVAAGFQIVVGHHPHVPQGIVCRNNSIIAFSLGNFLFGDIGRKLTPKQRVGYALEVVISGNKIWKAKVLPFQLFGKWRVRLLEGKKKKIALQLIKRLGSRSQSGEQIKQMWREEANALLKKSMIPTLAGKMLSAYSGKSITKAIRSISLAIGQLLFSFGNNKQASRDIENQLIAEAHRSLLAESFSKLGETNEKSLK